MMSILPPQQPTASGKNQMIYSTRATLISIQEQVFEQKWRCITNSAGLSSFKIISIFCWVKFFQFGWSKRWIWNGKLPPRQMLVRSKIFKEVNWTCHLRRRRGYKLEISLSKISARGFILPISFFPLPFLCVLHFWSRK